MGREDNVRIFQDTEKLVKENTVLKNAVKNSNDKQVLVPEQAKVSELIAGCEDGMNRYTQDAGIVVSKKRTYEAAASYKADDIYKNMQVCVHNFASATNPGGGVVKGSSAQEECLCRCSTLYFNLNTPAMWGGFYSPHRNERNPIHNDDCIYTPDVVVFKSDTANPVLLPEKDWYKVNVITCAAPNLRLMPGNAMNFGDGDRQAKISDDDLYNLHVKRLSRILDIAVAGRNDIIILGAFGCGAFENNPEVVARASKTVVDKYRKNFKRIEFAIYCSPRHEQNYDVFRRIVMD